jgi:hypothetical protein
MSEKAEHIKDLVLESKATDFLEGELNYYVY